MSKRVETIKEQIMVIRDSGAVNMLSFVEVQTLANKHGFYELASFMERNTTEYLQFVCNGDESLLEVK